MITRETNINAVWATAIVDELVRCGVRCFVLASGARCGPLSFELARRKDIGLVVHFDERATAYYALGHARATGTPAAWVTTSGTAVANGLPAVVEAAMDRLPLILLTADRPPELRATGANQAIDQVKLFGDYLRWQFDLPCPDPQIPLSMPMTTVAQACYRAVRLPAGPVHLNCMFREPLTPDSDGQDYGDYVKSGRSTHYDRPLTVPDPQAIDAVRNELRRARRGWIILGHIQRPCDRDAARELAGRIGWPVFADVTSGCRFDAAPENLIPYFDQVLLPDAVRQAPPDTVLHVGGRFVSKRLLEHLGAARPERYIHIRDFPDRHDPAQIVTQAIESDLDAACRALLADGVSLAASEDLSAWQARSSVAGRVMDEACAGEGAVDEPFVARTVSRMIRDDSGLFLANSMPIRDMDMYGAPGRRIRVGANRGASGIDGTLASAIGYFRGLDRPCTLVIGDLAFLHDLTSLRLLRQLAHPMVIVLINNNGGGIFSFLPAARHPDPFETCFGTPHDLTFESAAAQFGVRHVAAESRAAFRSAYESAQGRETPTLIEVRTDRRENAQRHRDLQARIVCALEAP